MLDQRSEPRFTTVDGVEVAEYPRVSRSAVIALLLGLISIAALASPLLWLLPVAGLAFSMVALRSLARADEPRLGRRAAMVGLILSLLFLGWAPTHYFLRQELLVRRAIAHSSQWLGLLGEGRLYEAHQLTIGKDERQPPGVDLDEYYENSQDVWEGFQVFISQPPLEQVIELGDRGQVRYIGRVEVAHERPLGRLLDLVTLRYAVDYEQDGQARTVPLWVGVARTHVRDTGEAYWYISGVRDPDDETN
jgi:hypothetical protein